MRQNKDRFEAPEVPAVAQSNLSGLNYVIPTELVELPSKGFFYPSSHLLYKQEFIEIKHMTAKEEDIMTSTTLIEKGVVLDYVIQSLILNKDINAKSLLPGDRSAILLNARLNGYGPKYNFQYSCANCYSSHETSCDLSEIKNKDFNSDLIPESGFITVELPKTKFSATFRYLNSHEEELLQKEIEKKNKMGLGDASITTFLKFVVTEINGIKNVNGSEVSTFLENMPALDAQHLRTKYAELKPDVDFIIDVECKECKRIERSEVPITAQFFWPNTRVHGDSV